MAISRPAKKVFFLGDSFVGKSRLIYCMLNDIAYTNYTQHAIDDHTTVFRVTESSTIKYDIIDVKANSLYFAFNCAEIAKSADLIVMVYEADNNASWKKCKKMLAMMADVSTKCKPVMLVGNKADRCSKSYTHVNSTLPYLMNQRHYNYRIANHFFVSALASRNVAKLYAVVVKELGYVEHKNDAWSSL